MSRLINPGSGDYADRLTVLALKLLFGEAAGKDTTHFRNERNAILTILGPRTSPGWLEQLVELAAVNGALWHAEDDLRACRGRPEGQRAQWTGLQGKTFLEEVAELAFRIQELNDRRAGLIEQINQKAGEHLGEEKLV